MNSKIVIDVSDATVRFNMASQKVNNIKEYMIKLVKKELMFQEFFALQDINFQVKEGESWGIIGTNGSGKSTLLKLICGILKPYKGSVNISGTLAPLIELGAGFDGELTARENIFLNGTLLGYSEEFMKEHFNEIVEFAELWDFLDVPIKNYSSGMAARLGFSVATMVQPDILICDEVLSVGDFKFQEKCEERMQNMLSSGTTLLYVSHTIQSVEKLCNHVLWLNKGKIVKVEEIGNKEEEETTKEETVFTVKDVKKGEKALKENGYEVSMKEGKLSVNTEYGKVPEVIKILVKNNIDIFNVIQKEKSLEDIFFAATERQGGKNNENN